MKDFLNPDNLGEGGSLDGVIGTIKSAKTGMFKFTKKDGTVVANSMSIILGITDADGNDHEEPFGIGKASLKSTGKGFEGDGSIHGGSNAGRLLKALHTVGMPPECMVNDVSKWVGYVFQWEEKAAKFKQGGKETSYTYLVPVKIIRTPAEDNDTTVVSSADIDLNEIVPTLLELVGKPISRATIAVKLRSHKSDLDISDADISTIKSVLGDSNVAKGIEGVEFDGRQFKLA